MEWQSDRQRQEQFKRDRMQIFDDFIDLALDGVITLEQAILGVKEVLEAETEIGKVA